MLGRLASEAAPDLLLCVADATNLRVALRLVIELKQVGRPMLLVLNMIDIARRRGIDIDLEKLSAELGVPVVTSTAVRRGGTEELLRRIDEMAASAAGKSVESTWQTPTTSDLRASQREADRVIKAAVGVPSRPDTMTGRVDAVLLHPVAGLLILLALLFVMFQAVFAWAKPLMDLIAAGFDWLGVLAHDALPEGLLQSFIQNGVLSGVGSVLVFLPQILILFLFILLLEDLGYMARAAFLMDRIMGGAGLHGRAFIPLLSSFACAIPGIMATRVIDNKRDRLTTILVAPLMTCSARIPVYTLIISAFIPDRQVWGFVGLQGLVMFGLYAAGIVSALGVSFIANHFFWRENTTPPFMLELPDYKLPRVAQRRHRALHPRHDVPEARRHHDLLDDGADLVPGVVPAAAGGRDGTGDRLQPRRHHRQMARADHGAGRLQLADQRRAHSRHGGARGRGGVARHGLCDRGRQGSRRADRPGARQQVEPRHRAGVAGLVHFRAAVRVDARRHQARDRKLEVDVRHLRLHAGAGLHRRRFITYQVAVALGAG